MVSQIHGGLVLFFWNLRIRCFWISGLDGEQYGKNQYKTKKIKPSPYFSVQRVEITFILF